MSKAQETREKILKQAADLFNQQGYAGSSISDVMRVTGLQKGGIYNHFESKQELAIAAFDFAFQHISQQFREALKNQRTAVGRLQAILSVFRLMVENPPIAGGCLLLNTAIESDDTNPELRDRTQKAMDSWRSLISRVVTEGIARGEISATVKADTVATIMIATLEGSIMLSKLYGDTIHTHRAIAHLNDYINHQLVVERS